MLTTWFLTELQKICKVVLIAGNHDLLENNKDRLDSISPIVELLADKDIEYYKESKCYVDNNVVWSVYSIFEENKRPNIEISRVDNYDKLHIGLFHAPIIGLTTDIGYEFESGANLEIFNGCDMVLCGDIHKRQVLYNSEEKEIDIKTFSDDIKLGWEDSNDKLRRKVPIAMPSSLIQQNFGESINKHGFLMWDLETRTFTEHDIETDFGFYQFKINSIDDIETQSEKLTNG
jgi:DNA repair exonuclease SbcCD nuclease subunit